MTLDTRATTPATARPFLRRTSPLRFALTVCAALTSSLLTLAGVLALFELEARATTLARGAAPAIHGTASASAEPVVVALPGAASGG